MIIIVDNWLILNSNEFMECSTMMTHQHTPHLFASVEIPLNDDDHTALATVQRTC